MGESEGRNTERTFPDEIVIPEKVKDEAAKGLERFKTKILSFNPDLILVLQRSGSLAYAMLEGNVAANEFILPAKRDILIGREVSEECGLPLDELYYYVQQEENPTFPFDKTGVQVFSEYYEWIRSQLKDRQSPMARTNKQLKTLVGNINPKKVLIFDDCLYSGTTLYCTAPFLVKDIVPGANIDVFSFFNNAGWLRDIIIKNFPFLQASDPQTEANLMFVMHLVKGSIDEGGVLKKITADNIASISLQVQRQMAERHYGGVNDPMGELKIPIEQLLSLNSLFVSSLKKLGQNLP